MSTSKPQANENDDSQLFHTAGDTNMDTPPAYTTTSAATVNGTNGNPENPPTDAKTDALTAAIGNLSISPEAAVSSEPQGLYVDACLAHLKLLHAIQTMKDDVGYTDGLWDIWNTRVEYGVEDLLAGGDGLLAAELSKMTDEERKMASLSKICEKRWALFVARAVDRYAVWWGSMIGKNMLTEEDMAVPNSQKHMHFPTTGVPMVWEEHMLPPLDVLMVIHTHMLNPRSFLEDTMRHGLSEFWAAGMPWALINEAIDSDFNYNVSPKAKELWVTQTGRAWANQDDPLTKTLKCPFCSINVHVPWTTCGMSETSKATKNPSLVGRGYGDGDFRQQCPSCKNDNYKELLSVSKFIQDTSLLLGHSVPMPGTILDPTSGQPELVPGPPSSAKFQRTFPNRMIKLELRIKILELIKPVTSDEPTTTTSSKLSMKTIRNMIETTLTDSQKVRNIDSQTPFAIRYAVPPIAKVCVRKMMSRYWENFSPFALDLCAAVMRQGVFVEKMNKLDWLHSPSAGETMTRLIKKYTRFVAIMAANPTQTAVPTLDVDLAWHTHQLSPSYYYAYTIAKTGKFIDHDDKIDEDRLSSSFEWTSKTYLDLFGEVYSDYPLIAHIIRRQVVWRFKRRESRRVILPIRRRRALPPDNSAHISSHNAVKTVETYERQRVMNILRGRQHAQLEKNYQKAAKRAEKKGRKLPPREEYYNHWGYSYYSTSDDDDDDDGDDIWRFRVANDMTSQCMDLTCTPYTLPLASIMDGTPVSLTTAKEPGRIVQQAAVETVELPLELAAVREAARAQTVQAVDLLVVIVVAAVEVVEEEEEDVVEVEEAAVEEEVVEI
ncbi:hypothetical protein PT974_03204 [Cladobotryum mycophilum]|uniref:Uncharacterized protein n=1 Tax=Cladobotryum mycophilum TaxID=491253 RepID=A0ABR0SST9_9HYPO